MEMVGRQTCCRLAVGQPLHNRQEVIAGSSTMTKALKTGAGRLKQNFNVVSSTKSRRLTKENLDHQSNKSPKLTPKPH